jgi:hypothetical protein
LKTIRSATCLTSCAPCAHGAAPRTDIALGGFAIVIPAGAATLAAMASRGCSIVAGGGPGGGARGGETRARSKSAAAQEIKDVARLAAISRNRSRIHAPIAITDDFRRQLGGYLAKKRVVEVQF